MSETTIILAVMLLNIYIYIYYIASMLMLVIDEFLINSE
jgi:hypothetical protein